MMITREYSKLFAEHKQRILNTNLSELFESDKSRAAKFSLQLDGLYFDFSKNLIDAELFKTLIGFAQASGLKDKIQAMFKGQKINSTEDRAVLHTALRNFSQKSIMLDGVNIVNEIEASRKQLASFADSIYHSLYKSAAGECIDTIVNIGIGGSDLGPKMAATALAAYSNKNHKHYYLSNIDPTALDAILGQINPAKTLFIIASKTFTTEETITNAKAAKEWLRANLPQDYDYSLQFAALTTNIKAATEFGVRPEAIFGFWDWVGGRYSMASAIGLSLMIAIGSENFELMLRGMENIDLHLQNTPFDQNIPVLMGLLGYLYNNVYNAGSQAILPYCDELRYLSDYLQQLEMESNGKMVDCQNNFVDYQTAAVIWGGVGTDAQHSFFQLLHQGTKLIPADFIGFCRSNSKNSDSFKLFMSNFFAQQHALAFGSKSTLNIAGAETTQNYKYFNGNRPSTCFLFEQLTPYTLGQIIALYEHKVFCLGVMWNINSFDQWGVELGKKIAKKIQPMLNAGGKLTGLDQSSSRALMFFNEHRE